MMRGEAAFTAMPRVQEVVVPQSRLPRRKSPVRVATMPFNCQDFCAPWRFASGMGLRQGLHNVSVKRLGCEKGKTAKNKT